MPRFVFRDRIMNFWQTARFRLSLERPLVMGIVNVTPDSFSDGGKFGAAEAGCRHCDALLAQGADVLDIGGESTRPGAQMPSVAEELARVIPVVKHAVRLGVPVSVDTSRSEVIGEMLALGVDIINDVRALTCPGALAEVARVDRAGVCLMHMQGSPSDMQDAPAYADVVAEVRDFLRGRLLAARMAGVADDRLVVDPGYGFGKRHEHNLALLKAQHALLSLGRPLLVGLSRKGMLGQITGRALPDRLAASVAAALAAVSHGARIVRVHDVAATVDALRIWSAAGLAGDHQTLN
jgi:dihydropteroate synthase